MFVPATREVENDKCAEVAFLLVLPKNTQKAAGVDIFLLSSVTGLIRNLYPALSQGGISKIGQHNSWYAE